MRKHLVLATVMAVVVGLLLAACGSPPTPTPRPTATPRPEAMPAPTAMMLPTPTLRPGQPTPTPTPVPPGVTVVPTPTAAAAVPTPTLDASFTAEWERLIAAAQEEGKLVIAGGGGVQSIAPIYKIFEDKFGIKVVLGRGSSTEHANRILAEQAAGRFTVDVAHSGANSANVRYIANGMAQPIAPWIFHPEAAPENWFGDRWWWTDAEEKYHLVMTSSISSGSGGDFWWNTNNMSLEEVASWTTWRDVFSDDQIGRVISLTHQVGGATGGDLKSYLDPNQGVWYFERLKTEMDAFFTSDFNYIADSLTLGKQYNIAVDIGSAGTILDEIRDKGGPVESYTDAYDKGLVPGLENIRTLNATGGAGGMLLLMRNVPHPNATKLYVNWMLSREGQQTIHDTPGEGTRPDELHTRVSLRRGIEPGLTRPDRRWVEGQSYANVDMQPDLRPLATDIYDYLRSLEMAGEPIPLPFDPLEYRDRVLLQ